MFSEFIHVTSFVVTLIVFEIGSHEAQAGLKLNYVAEVGPELLILLPPPSEWCDYKCAPPYFVFSFDRFM